MDNNDDLDEEFVFLLQLMLAEQNAGTHFEDEILAYAGLVCYGLEEAHRLRVLRQSLQRLYLTYGDLLPNPRMDTPWLALYQSK
jgi:hypothetical protein